MIVQATKPLFAGDEMQPSPTLATIRAALEAIPDAPLLSALRARRHNGCDLYPVRVLWGVLLLAILLRHATTEACLEELLRNAPLRLLVGIESEDAVPHGWNLTRFLAPQFNARGKSLAPANYARLYAAAYAGIKAGNSRARVAIGETSPRGSDKPGGLRPDHSPGRFAELVAKANPRLKFDAWAHHPYPFRASAKPNQVVKWPNVTLSSLPRFETELKRWFKRKTVPIWVTEYGHETNPPDRSFGISYTTQAAYLRQAIAMAKKLPYVEMFIWFVYHDSEGQPWDSGLYTRSGSAKGSSPNAFSKAAKPLDARNAVYTFRRGTLTPSVTLYTRRYCVGDTTGEAIGMTWRIFIKNRLIAVDQQTSPLRSDCTITARLRFPRGGVQRNTTYTATFALNDINGTVLNRRLTIRAT